jgi:hypothetical protein
VLDDRRRDYVALGVGQGLLFSADLKSQGKARTSLRNSSVAVGAQIEEHNENETNSKNLRGLGTK